MKGIELCAECAYYNMKSHKCARGCKIDPDSKKGEDVRFFVDCPLPDVQPVKHGKWEELTNYGGWGNTHCRCSVCGEGWYLKKGTPQQNNMNFCPRCGSRMDGDADA